MKNTLEIIENSKVIASTSFSVIDAKAIKWIDSLNNELKQEEGYTKTAFYGEELKLQLEVEGIDDDTELEVEIIAKNDEGTIVELEEDERQPLVLTSKITANKVTFEPFYLNPKWFDKEAPVTYFFNLKIKEEDTYIAKDLPTEEEDQLKPIGFGKPDLFKIDKTKGYLLQKQSDGTKIAYTSGDRLDIEIYQDWFENDSDEIDFKNKDQRKTYFESVYLVHLWEWSITGEFETKANRELVIAEFEKAGKKHNIAPSILWAYAAGEGLVINCSWIKPVDLNRPVSSFQAFGTDYFENHAKLMKTRGYLDNSFTANKTPVIRKGTYKNYTDHLPAVFTGDYAVTRFKDGKQVKRFEKPDLPHGTPIYPVYFKNIFKGIEGSSSIYANAFDYAQKSATALGWGKLTLDQQVFHGYLKIQQTSENGNAEINKFRKDAVDATFLDRDYNFSKFKNDDGIPRKQYNRWVVWRAELLSKNFSS